MEDKQFWMDIGVKLGQSLECSKNVEEKLDHFIGNDHKHVVKKVDTIDVKLNKVVAKVAWIVGSIAGAFTIANILIRVL